MNQKSAPELIDTHCHLDFPEFDTDREKVIERAKSEGLTYIINIGSSLQNSYRSVGLAEKYDFIYSTVGIHPHEADSFTQQVFDEIKKLAQNKKVVSIGEIGLDYFRNYAKVENQKRLFISLINLAKDLSLPMVIHCRDAQNDVLDILKPILPHKIIIHCFSGNEDFLKTCLEQGFYISFTLNITYKKAQRLRDLIRIVPLEKLFLETDAPFLPPENLRGKRNEPAYVKTLAQEIAKIKDLTFEKIAEITTFNAKQFFNLK